MATFLVRLTKVLRLAVALTRAVLAKTCCAATVPGPGTTTDTTVDQFRAPDAADREDGGQLGRAGGLLGRAGGAAVPAGGWAGPAGGVSSSGLTSIVTVAGIGVEGGVADAGR